jgi:hypothetical protein
VDVTVLVVVAVLVLVVVVVLVLVVVAAAVVLVRTVFFPHPLAVVFVVQRYFQRISHGVLTPGAQQL